ncbi:hydrogenase assembly protein HupF [Actinomadura viridis]|uniref:hydrogenase assembly protein HupF n=1 Tax=Actinomadura viridis TaxID=58110 RepID=UPI00368272AC
MTPQEHCHGEVCVTCADTAERLRVRALLGDGLALADTLADTGAGPEEISVALVDAGEGDVVLVHAKEAIAVVRAVPDGTGDRGPDGSGAAPRGEGP